MKVITFAGFSRGGKSSVSRLVAERTKSSILNFDTKRNAEFYNAVNTVNIKPDYKISRKENSILLSTDIEEKEIESTSGVILCDLGGYFDERLIPINSDYYIIPTFDDFESLSESMRTANYIIERIPNAKIIFILNGALIGSDSKLKKEKLSELQEHLKVNKLDMFPVMYLGHTRLMRRLVDEAVKRKDIKGKYGQEVRYPSIDKFITKLLKKMNIKG